MDARLVSPQARRGLGEWIFPTPAHLARDSDTTRARLRNITPGHHGRTCIRTRSDAWSLHRPLRNVDGNRRDHRACILSQTETLDDTRKRPGSHHPPSARTQPRPSTL
jgi:hypothetical protein